MNLINNPFIKAELDNLERQFGNKAMLNIDDYCALFDTGRKMATRHMKRRGVPRVKVGRDVLIPTLELALFLARKKALNAGLIVPVSTVQIDHNKHRGFAHQNHLKQLAGDNYILSGKEAK